MSDYRAIQGVTSSIKNLLERFMFLNHEDVADAERVKIIAGLPDQENEGKRVNLFLYHLTECPYLKNQDVIGAAHPGEYGRPPLVLELHYLITAYATSDEGDQIEAHQILGDAVRALHDHALLGGDILDPALEGAVERAHITLEPLTVEDVTKIWVALNTPYRLSVGYKVTVVQIPSRLQRSFPGLVSELPAGGPRVVVSPIRGPGIDEMYVIRQGDALRRERVAYGRIGDTLVVKGRNLAGEVRLLLDQVDATASITSRRDTRIEATIPDDVSLQPGAVTVRVAAEVLLGDPQVAHRGLSSNLSAFVLIPHARQLKPNLGADPRTLQVLGSRLYAEHKECLTLIGDRVITSTHYTAQHENEIALNLPGDLGAGTYAVRVRVTGAESLDVQNLVIP